MVARVSAEGAARPNGSLAQWAAEDGEGGPGVGRARATPGRGYVRAYAYARRPACTRGRIDPHGPARPCRVRVRASPLSILSTLDKERKSKGKWAEATLATALDTLDALHGSSQRPSTMRAGRPRNSASCVGH